uniref:Uncharacterized protein n=1 Tax=Panagrolaimus sp. ES5 TaxID=591445 RepID=A0AC34G988_9BILA
MESESDISLRKSDSKRIVIEHTTNIQKSVDEKQQQTKALNPSSSSSSAAGGGGGSGGLANKISNFLGRRKSNASNS